MNYSVLLVQRGISSISLPITGKSRRLYGHAVQSPEHGGVSLLMSMEDYMLNAHDIVGNTEPNQQWVPEFVAMNKASAALKCDRCRKPAVSQSDRYFFCEEHAPYDAIYTDGSNETVGHRLGKDVPAKAPEVVVADVMPTVDERLSKPLEEGRELPKENFPAPAIGTEREDGPTPQMESGVFMPEKSSVTSQPVPTRVIQTPEKLEPGEPAGAKLPTPKQPGGSPGSSVTNAVAMIAAAVVEKITPKIGEIVDEKLAAFRPPAQTSKRKKSKPSGPPSEFRQLQADAKKLGINTYGKSAKTLREEIAHETF